VWTRPDSGSVSVSDSVSPWIRALTSRADMRAVRRAVQAGHMERHRHALSSRRPRTEVRADLGRRVSSSAADRAAIRGAQRRAWNMPYPLPVVPFASVRADIDRANAHIWSMVRSATHQASWRSIRAASAHPSSPGAPKLEFLHVRPFRRGNNDKIEWRGPAREVENRSSAEWPPPVVILNLLHRPERFHATLAELQDIGYPMDRVYRMEGVKGDVGYLSWYVSIMLVLEWVKKQGWEYFLFLGERRQ
jgi:hypothetical protein